jgi:hypothetical protein
VETHLDAMGALLFRDTASAASSTSASIFFLAGARLLFICIDDRPEFAAVRS